MLQYKKSRNHHAIHSSCLQKITTTMVLFIWNIQNKKTDTERGAGQAGKGASEGIGLG